MGHTMSEPRYHKVARCRWCRGRFAVAFMDGKREQWLCETLACAERQIANAIVRENPPEGASPYLYLPTPSQCLLIECRLPFLLFGGAAAGSKSHGLRWNAYRSCLAIPGYRVLLMRRTFPELEKTHLREMETEKNFFGATLKSRVLTFPNGSFIEGCHCDTKADMEKVLSTEYDEVDLDEGTTFESNMIREFSTRARSKNPDVRARGIVLADGKTTGGAFVRIGSNPGGPGHSYLSDVYVTKDPDPEDITNYDPDRYGFIQARVEDNPYVAEDYIETNLNGLSPTRQKQLRDGDWSVPGSQFFAGWDPNVHVRRLGDVLGLGA